MSLATRCTACGTVFRVVQDQLKVADGWVRCGRCNEVFSAAHHLIDLDENGHVRASAAGDAEFTELNRPFATSVSGGHGVPQVGLGANEAAALVSGQGGAPQGAATDLPLSPTEPILDAVAATSTVDIALEAGPAHSHRPIEPSSTALPDLRAEAAPTPSFIAKAERAARWHRPGMRIALAAVAAVLVLLLAGQLIVNERDRLAAHWKQSRPLLDAFCQALGCQIQALRRIEQVSVESSGLTRIDGSPLYRVNLVLRNRAGTELAVPAIDLSLTDAQGQVIARRVLSAAELGSQAAVVAPGAELGLQAMLSTGSRRVAGYTIEVFYP